MVRNILGIIAGVIVGGIVIGIVEMAGHMIFPPPEGVDLKNPGELQNIMSEIPLGAKIAVLVAWFIGITAGGVVARIITHKAGFASWIVAALLFGAAAYTMTKIPHPSWMIVGAVAVTLLGAFLANKLTPRTGLVS